MAVVPTRAESVGTEHEKPIRARARSLGNMPKLPSGPLPAIDWNLGTHVAAEATFANKTDLRC